MSGRVGQRPRLDELLTCRGATDAACHILRTDREIEGAIPPDYVERVNRAIDYIVRNIAQPLKLEEVSRAAYFSPFHFHRIFKSLLGETLKHLAEMSLGQADYFSYFCYLYW